MSSSLRWSPGSRSRFWRSTVRNVSLRQVGVTSSESQGFFSLSGACPVGSPILPSHVGARGFTGLAP